MYNFVVGPKSIYIYIYIHRQKLLGKKLPEHFKQHYHLYTKKIPKTHTPKHTHRKNLCLRNPKPLQRTHTRTTTKTYQISNRAKAD